jgi:hypothetical protein
MEWAPDLVVSISIPDNNAFRDACLREYITGVFGIPMVMHPINSLFVLANKWATNNWLQSHGFNAPSAIYISGDLVNKRTADYSAYITGLKQELHKIEGPYVVKPLWDSMSQGVETANTVDEVIKRVCESDYDLIVQEKVVGELFGIEVITNGKSCLFQPLVKKCSSENDLVPFDHLRYGPYQISKEQLSLLKRDLASICEKLKLNGSVEFEMIRSKKDNKFFIIEINPRVSGMTNLSSAISNINSYSFLMRLNKDVSINDKLGWNAIAEIPLLGMSADLMNAVSRRPEVSSIQCVKYHTGNSQYKALVKGKNIGSLYKLILQLSKQLSIIPDYILKECEEMKARING